MKTLQSATQDRAAPIVRLLGAESGDDDVDVSGRTAARADPDDVAKARDFAAPLLDGRVLPSEESVLAHADGTVAILMAIGAAPSMQAAVYLLHAADQLGKPEEVLLPLFGASQTSLVQHARKLGELERTAQATKFDGADKARQVERARKMLLAFSRDLRVVLLRLASRLQTLRAYAASKRPCPASLADEALQIFAPLANRLGIWQIKWELEDLAFRFLDNDAYATIARLLDERRAARESRIEALRLQLGDDLAAHGIAAQVQGRPKHLYGIWKKMHRKGLGFDRVMDVLALRVIVGDVAACYAVLGRVHQRYAVVAGEFDDYIARPKPNGYRSLHTVVQADEGAVVEIQIRSAEMHEHAEYGVAAHWAYKESDSGKSRGSAAAAGRYEAGVAEARLAVLRQLLAWERDIVDEAGADAGPASALAPNPILDERVFVFTPQATLVELAAGATPIDFAYAVHTELGHRCRGAKVDGTMVPLDTPLKSGQMVEISSAKTGGPSLDWLNAELGYLQSPRSKAKVRAWFNALAGDATIARGREAIEKLLQREGKTALKLEDLAERLGFRSADALFQVVGKDELSLRNIEALLRPAPDSKPDDAALSIKKSRGGPPPGGVLVVGVESLLTNLARCCRPAPPDAISGYVTRGKGVAVHRAGCSNLRELTGRSPERVIPVAWGAPDAARPGLYPVDVSIEAADRQGLLRDVSEVFAKDKINVIGVKSSSLRDARGGSAFMTFTVEVPDASRLAATLGSVTQVVGVRSARRR
ncbi:MAG: bifunctional (p)ppGpp synthetase/guanosine-3',5'-bis(diphosphate) 3'-pyrophosphohydrolase [Pseudomonadota bacterium]|nr:bifunctional (p)ppGpp synthetase/guanosine-3',5'-bis(diphosphate) 3'-pyrophosphohydrolase [Pseudomonadota bacterium]